MPAEPIHVHEPILELLVIETITFRLADGVDEAEFLNADARVQTDFVYQQHGCVRRTTARSSEGEWLVAVFWGSERDADNAAKAAESDPVWLAFINAIDSSTLRVARHSTLD
jgi:hypothetical protein